MAQHPQNLVWIDLEMTGLDTQKDYIIEIATIVTDKDLNILAEGPNYAIYQPEEILNLMDDWNQKHHGSSGLTDRVRKSKINEIEAENQTLAFLQHWIPNKASPLCGNSICQDRRFLARHMPKLEAFFHYRNLDVSTLKELSIRWAPGLKDQFKKKNSHIALTDIKESIAELQFYRKHFIRF